MSAEQRENLAAILRQSAFPADSGVSEQRRLLRELTPAQPVAAGVTQAYYPILDETTAARDRAEQLLTAHLTGATRGTA